MRFLNQCGEAGSGERKRVGRGLTGTFVTTDRIIALGLVINIVQQNEGFGS